ncbi:MAG: protein kinase [Acidobacteria bacterium]|nr:protein kinase [Acidobacteriota bacterium]
MTPERYQTVKTIFQRALELPSAHRPHYLDHACGADPELRRAVESMLQSDTEETTFLDKPPVDPVSKLLDQVEMKPPSRVGQYEIIREIGRGGMGAVYLASRADDQYRKQVAIKLVLRDRENAQVLERFRRERQILANLDHPNIALLLDGGATADGLPYLVMEYVEGVPIDEYCDNAKLDISARLRLFLTVCAAVHHAHQNLVIHRDLKPSNILVKKDGTVKLLDFGIAKLVQTQPAAGQAMDKTATAMRILTPEYASPEQVRGDPVTTATDVYQLGVVLYELLTGHHPYAFKNRAAVMQMLLSDEPQRPSDAALRVVEEELSDGTKEVLRSPATVCVTREGTPQKLRKRLEGDLDSVLLKALSKEASNRYGSAEQFADDIRRHLEDSPVLARSHSMQYVAGRYLRRHKTGAAAAGFVFASLLVGIAVAGWEAHVARQERAKAQRRFEEVRRVANSFLFEVHDAMAPLAGTTPARRMVVRKAMEFFDSLAKESAGDASLQRELAVAYHRLGDLQGNPNVANLGDTSGALANYRKALAIRETLLNAAPQDPDLRRDLGLSFEAVADLYVATGNTDAALEQYQKARVIFESLQESNPTSRPILSLLAKSYHNVVGQLVHSGDTSRAMELSRKAMKISEDLVAQEPGSAEARRNLSVAYSRFGGVLDRMGDTMGALQNYQKALGIQEELARESPESAQTRREISLIYEDMGKAQATRNDVTKATENYRKALAIRKELAANDPRNAMAASDLGFIEMRMGDMLQQAGQRAQALDSYRHALEVFQNVAALDPANVLARRDTALIFERLGGLQAAAGNTASALDYYRRLQQVSLDWAARDASNAVAQHTLGVAHLRVSETHSRAGDRNAALQDADRALRVFQALQARDPNNVENQRGLAWAWIRKGEVLEATAVTASPSQKIQRWQEASGCYQQSLTIFAAIDKQKGMRVADTTLRQNVKSAFDHAEQEIRKLKETGKVIQL